MIPHHLLKSLPNTLMESAISINNKCTRNELRSQICREAKCLPEVCNRAAFKGNDQTDTSETWALLGEQSNNSIYLSHTFSLESTDIYFGLYQFYKTYFKHPVIPGGELDTEVLVAFVSSQVVENVSWIDFFSSVLEYQKYSGTWNACKKKVKWVLQFDLFSGSLQRLHFPNKR